MKKILVLSVCILCLCGCGKSKEKEEISQLEIDLKGNQTTGYEWECNVDSKEIAKMISNKYTQDDANKEMVGVGGTYKFIFEGVNAGTTTITCTYYRPFEIGEPLYKLEYIVSVNTKTKEISQYSKNGTYSEETIPDAKIIKTTK